MDIDELEAGRELDAIVALDVMGWKRHEWREHRALQRMVFCPKCGNTKAKVALSDFYEFCGTALLPRYSADIVAAWEVVEKLEYNWSLGRDVGQCSNDYETSGDKLYRFVYSAPGMPMQGISANTAPLAICRAALKAVNAE